MTSSTSVLNTGGFWERLWRIVRAGVLERRQREITALNDRLMKAQEEERTRIAGELHDSVLQQLTTVNLNVGMVKRKVRRGADADADIEGIEEQLIQLGTEIRQLSHVLHPAALNEKGLPKALANYCAVFSATRGIPVGCAAKDVDRLSQGTALALYRIAQEALGNVAKHAKAKAVRVQLDRAGDKVRLTVSDDGVGFVFDGNGAGVGLVNMRERVQQLGGRLELTGEPGRGTTIRAEVPFCPA
jgi:two-component system NarL family sensor kinase